MKILLPNKRAELGRLGEEFARAEYARQGFRIIASNIFNRRGKKMGELDFIALNGRDIVFVEVKTRSAASARFGTDPAAVSHASVGSMPAW